MIVVVNVINVLGVDTNDYKFDFFGPNFYIKFPIRTFDVNNTTILYIK